MAGLHHEVENHILRYVHHHSLDFNPCREVREIIAPVHKFGQSETSKILFVSNNAQNQVFLEYKLQGFSNAKKHLHQIYRDQILILSNFRANHKNDQKAYVNVQFSQTLQMIYANQLDIKERFNFFFISPNQIFHNLLSF